MKKLFTSKIIAGAIGPRLTRKASFYKGKCAATRILKFLNLFSGRFRVFPYIIIVAGPISSPIAILTLVFFAGKSG